jgi:branched-chain amino acid transport system ATP-binding protein
MLEVGNLYAGWGKTVVVEDVSIAVSEGQCLSVIGRNGVGKTTLFEAIVGRATIHSGSVSLAGRDITRADTYEKARSGLGYVPQNREVFKSLTVAEHLDVGSRPGYWNAAAVYDLFPALAARKRSLGGVLSGGEQQMLAIGRALTGNPRVMLLDEPTEGLSPLIVESLVHAIRTVVRQGMAVLLVEQHLEVAISLADTCVAMDRGQVVYAGSAEDLQLRRAEVESLVGVALADTEAR